MLRIGASMAALRNVQMAGARLSPLSKQKFLGERGAFARTRTVLSALLSVPAGAAVKLQPAGLSSEGACGLVFAISGLHRWK